MNNALEKFQKTVCPDIPLDSDDLTEKLIAEIAKLKEELELK